MVPSAVDRRTILTVTALLVLVVAVLVQPSQRVGAQRCTGERFDIVTAPGGLSPYVRLTADGTSGAFLIDTGAETSSLSRDVFPGSNGNVARFSLPTFPSGSFRLSKYWVNDQPAGGQLGIIGTDFLSLLTADFVFVPTSGSDVVLGGERCDGALLRQRGLMPIRQTGYFSADPGQPRYGRPNIPVVFLKAGNVQAYAQIDTGYDDRERKSSIDINEALYQKLVASGIALQPDGVLDVIACDGRRTVEAYRAPGSVFSIANESGDPIAALHDVRIVRKRANLCGGIATFAEPAAQIGVSVLYQLGQVVIDPRAEMVWVAGGR